MRFLSNEPYVLILFKIMVSICIQNNTKYTTSLTTLHLNNSVDNVFNPSLSLPLLQSSSKNLVKYSNNNTQQKIIKGDSVKKVVILLYASADLICDMPLASWWKRHSLGSSHRLLLVTRRQKVLVTPETGSVNLILTKLVDQSRRVSGSKLTISNVQIADEGYYECECLFDPKDTREQTDYNKDHLLHSRHHQIYYVEVVCK
ncbi:hypothetical protein GJ496_004610 [Pomphorhynchus laevis]|nr:hypothetical protein GJ496_004610 [Pomphorhynchus laevis]